MASTIQYSLSLWGQSPPLPLLETSPTLPHSLIFVAGLTDTFGTVPYIERLAVAVAPLGFNVVLPQLSSSLGGFGLSSLESDAQEIALVMRHLRTRSQNPKHPNAKVVVMGHSTGCQDMVHLLQMDRPGVGVDGVILQAPVSDRDDWNVHNKPDSPAFAELKEATKLVEQGEPGKLMPRNIAPIRKYSSQSPQANANAVQKPAMTAYRFWSLYAPGGDDDFFSLDLDEKTVTKIWSNVLGEHRFVTALLGAEDEYVPTEIGSQKLATHWNETAKKNIPEQHVQRLNIKIVPKANHKVVNDDAQKFLVNEVYQTLHRVLGLAQETPSSSISSELAKGINDTHLSEPQSSEKYPASFDEVVELISTGRADSIPGIKHIPLQINDASPSEATMRRPAKPWEQGNDVQPSHPPM